VLRPAIAVLISRGITSRFWENTLDGRIGIGYSHTNW
jgi:hypothetical protein